MPTAVRSFRYALVLALTLVSVPAFADNRISLRMEIYGVLGLHVLTLRTVLDETTDRYAITADYATTGLAGVLDDQHSHAEVYGRLKSASAEPVAFRSTTRENGIDILKKVDYRPGGLIEASTTPPRRYPVAPEATRGTVDNLTAYFLLQRQLARRAACALTIPVFDGRHRYDLSFADEGHETLSSDGGQQFQGAVIGCGMVRHLVGTSDREDIEGAQSGTIWYASLLPGDVAVPVRMKLQTQIGSVDAYLAELHGRGVDLVLMK